MESIGELDLLACDAGDIYDDVILSLSEAVGEPLYPGDERRIFAEALVALLTSERNVVEDAASQTALKYARGTVLDALGDRLNVTRLAGTPATVTLKFTLSGERNVSTAIPKWTKATADGEIYFATDDDAVIPAGETTVMVQASSVGSGESGNGYLPGAISTLVDKIPYIQSVVNTTQSDGGSDGELYTEEGDDHFRERIRLAVSALSVAGPERAYEYYAKSADAAIADVAIISETEDVEREYEVVNEKVYIGGDLLVPDSGLQVDGKDEGFTYAYEDSLLVITITDEETKVKPKVKVRCRRKMDGRIRIVPLMSDGEDPSDDVLKRILDACNAKDVRPMTDVVTVDKPSRKSYDIELAYWVSPETEAEVVKMVEGSGGAIERFVADQDSVLGRDINPDMLAAYVMKHPWDSSLEGPIRVKVTSPVYTPVGAGEAAKFSRMRTVTHHLESQARWDT